MGSWKNRIIAIVLLTLIFFQVAGAQGAGGAGSAGYEWLDELFPYSDVNDSGSFFYNVFLPFIGILAILYFVLLGAFNWAAGNMPSGASTVPKKSAIMLSAVLSFLILRFYPLGIFAFLLAMAGLAGLAYAIYRWWSGFNLGGGGGGGNSSNPPSISVGFNPSNPSPGMSSDDIEMQISVSDNSGSGLDKARIEFDSYSMDHSLNGPSDSASIPITNIRGGSSPIPAGSYSYRVVAEDNDGNTNGDSGHLDVNGGGGGSTPPSITTLRASDAGSGASANDIDIHVSCSDNSSSGLDILEIKVPAFGSQTFNLGGADSHSEVYNLNSDILGGSNPSISDGTYDVIADLADNNGEVNQETATFTVGNGSSGSGGGPGGNQQQLFAALFGGQGGDSPDININNQQMQQQMMMWHNMMNQMQMQQQMMTPAMMQFAHLLEGNVQIGNNNVMIPGQNGNDVDIDIDVIRQLIKILGQTEPDQEKLLSIISLLIIEGDRGLNQQLIQQIIDIDIEESQGDLTIEQTLEQEINHRHVEELEQVFVNYVENNLQQESYEQFALQITEFLVAVHNGDFRVEGDEVTINIQDFGDLKIHYNTLIRFAKLINQVPENIMQTLVAQIVNNIIVNGEETAISEKVIREIIFLIKEIEKGDIEGGGENTQINVENIYLFNLQTGDPLPENQLDNGGFVYEAPAGIRSDQIEVNPRVSCNGMDLQEIMVGLSGGKLDQNRQKRIGVNGSSYGYNGEGITLADAQGEFRLERGEQYSLNVTVTTQNGQQEDRVARIQVGGSAGPDFEPTLDPGSLEEDIRELIEQLREGDKIDQDILEKHREAAKRLKEALKELLEMESVFRAIIYFREVDVEKESHAQVHQKVEKIVRNINGVGSASTLETKVEEVEDVLMEIEKALAEVQEAFKESEDHLKDKEAALESLDEAERIVNEIIKGSDNYQKCVEKGWHNSP